MWLGKALRRVCSSPSTPSNPQTNQKNSSSHSNTFTKSNSARLLLRLRRKPRRSTPSNSLSTNNYLKKQQPQPQPQQQQKSQSFTDSHYHQKQQEVAVISDYRDRLENFANAAKHIHRVLDTEPGDSNAIIDLRSLRTHLHNALESYFAATGNRSTQGLSSIIPTIERTDIRLADIEQEVLTEVKRFDDAACSISARFAVADSSVQRTDVIADADHTLIELEIYRSSWASIMDSATANRLEKDSKLLRQVVAPTSEPSSYKFNFPNDTSRNQLDTDLSSNLNMSNNWNHIHHSKRQQSLLNGHRLDHYQKDKNHTNSNHSPIPNGYASSSKRHNHLESNDSFFLSAKYPPPLPLPEFSYTYLNQTDTDGNHTIPTPIPSNSSNDSDSSETGDEGPRKMVMSRTRTLRDMAETAMSVDKDDHLGTYNSSMDYPCISTNPISNTSPQASSSTSYQRKNRLQSDTSGRESSDADSQPPKLGDTKNISFATAFFKTSRQRADSISDAGVMLRRSNVRGDGRCLFRALARGRIIARGRPIPSERVEREEADHLRQKAVAELKKHRKLLARSFVIEGDFNTYTRKMAHPRTYGGEPELLMLAKVLHVPIAVYIAKNGTYRRIQVYGKMYCGDPLRILYSDGIHYDALLTMR